MDLTPIDILVEEHNVIRVRIKLVEDEAERIRDEMTIKERFIVDTVDFMRSFADVVHHVKEERILFAKLAGSGMSKEDSDGMAELSREHAYARGKTDELAAAYEGYAHGEANAGAVLRHLNELAVFYLKHVEKEEAGFFASAMRYLNEDEKQGMALEMLMFDKERLLEGYRAK
jgi:hemerythrin-like domain-containing protein